jgi:hypothetical protein
LSGWASRRRKRSFLWSLFFTNGCHGRSAARYRCNPCRCWSKVLSFEAYSRPSSVPHKRNLDMHHIQLRRMPLFCSKKNQDMQRQNIIHTLNLALSCQATRVPWLSHWRADW